MKVCSSHEDEESHSSIDSDLSNSNNLDVSTNETSLLNNDKSNKVIVNDYLNSYLHNLYNDLDMKSNISKLKNYENLTIFNSADANKICSSLAEISCSRTNRDNSHSIFAVLKNGTRIPSLVHFL